MVIKKGYKKNERGITPEDWIEKRIGDFADMKTGGTPSTAISSYWDGEIRWMNSGDLHLKKVYEVEGRITELGLNNSNAHIIPRKCILIGLAGQGKTRGTVAMNLVKLTTNQSIAAIYPCEEVLSEFLYYNLDSRYNELRMLSTGDGGRGGLNLGILKRLYVQLPNSKIEQNAIVDALSGTDALISSLEKLIAKKRMINKGAMQKLFIPQPDWQPMKVGELIEFQGGSQPPRDTFVFSEKEGYVRLLQIRDYKSDRYASYIPMQLANRFCEKDDIMIGRYGPPIFQILRGLEGAYNVALMKAVPSPKLNKEYAYFFLKQDKLFQFIEKLSQRSSGQTGVDLQELKAYPFPRPSLRDQAKIASILIDMEAELDALETKLTKYKMIKQGMMQNLLTGKIRLV